MRGGHFPSFWEGLSLRRKTVSAVEDEHGFPFLLGGTFIEARVEDAYARKETTFPFLLGRAFIEAACSLCDRPTDARISLPFGKGFH